MKYPALKYLRISFFFFSIAILLSSCGGGGGSGGGGNPATPPPPTILSGTVQAPGGQIAFLPHQNLIEQFVNVVLPSANALISGLSPVPDGTTVELDRISDTGTIVVTISTTTTSGGNYSFNLTKLGISFSSDLIVLVSNAKGVQMRAFAGIGITNINPVSEAALRIVLEMIATHQGMFLANFTPKEQNDVMASIDLLTTLKQLPAGSDIETTVTAIKNTVSVDTGVMAFITSASAAGQTSDGPGDIGNFFPLTIGNVWKYQRTDTKTNFPSSPAFNMTHTISGTKLVNNTQTFVITESNFDNTGASRESYWAKDKTGYAEYGDSGSASTLISQITPVINAIFPLQPNLTFGQINRTGLNFGQDLDGDGINETFDVVYQTKVAAFETLNVQVGTFTNVAKFERVLTLTVHLSKIHQDIVSGGPVTEWFGPGIGLIKSIQQINTTGPGLNTQETITDEITGYFVDGNGRGILPEFTIAQGVVPGKSAIGTDGTNYFLVSCSSTNTFGVILSGKGEILKTFQVAQQACPSEPSVAFDGTNYLVVFQQNGQINGTRISPTGIVLDGPNGFSISTGIPFSITNFSPAVAFDGTNYLVVWVKYDSSLAGLCSSLLCDTLNFIFGARVTPSGQVLGEFQIFKSQGYHYSPSVAFDGANYLVVWSNEYGGPGSSIYSSNFAIYEGIHGTRVTPGGVILDSSAIVISTYGPLQSSPGSSGVPQIVFDGMNYFVVWLREDISSFLPAPAKLFGMRIKPDGTLLDGPPDTGGIAINTSGLPISNPALTFDGNNYFVAYAVGTFPNSPPAGIFANRVSTSGTLIDGPSNSNGILVSKPPCGTCSLGYPEISFNGKNSLLSWVNNNQLSGASNDILGVLIYPF